MGKVLRLRFDLDYEINTMVSMIPSLHGRILSVAREER